MNPDVSVAPEIAQLMAPLGLLHPNPHPAAVTRLSVGDLARQLKLITGAPERWWHLVRFDPGQPVVVDIPVDGPYRAWLTILPPAATATRTDSATETGERSDVISLVCRQYVGDQARNRCSGDGGQIYHTRPLGISTEHQLGVGTASNHGLDVSVYIAAAGGG